MEIKEVKIKLKDGVHARPAALLVQKANKYKSSIMIKKDDIEVNAKSIMNIMMLALTYGTKISVIADGEDEKDACDDLVRFIENDFKEG